MQSRCAELAERVSAWVDGELSGEELRAVRDHVAGCPDCRAFAAACRSIDGAVTSGLRPPLVDGRRWDAMLTRLRAAAPGPEAARRRRARILGAVAFAAAVAAACLLALLPAYTGRPRRERDYRPARGVRLERTDRTWDAQVLVAPENGLTMVLVADAGSGDRLGPPDYGDVR